jgi:serine/threonine protein kinase
MEYCGIDLFTVLYDLIHIPNEWFINIAKGIKCMHDNDYAHLDIKPENIVIQPVSLNKSWGSSSSSSRRKLQLPEKKIAKLIDFGLSLEIRGHSTNVFNGTTGYRAPELYGIDKVDLKKCDIYSLGVTIGICLYITMYRREYTGSLEDIKSADPIKFIEILAKFNLQNMINDNPDERPDIDMVIKLLLIYNAGF